ncbi:MAG: hypothetical protein LBQ75_04630, partial [Zoogloeaceae bacterium]|nr:hypothetical protein [Zoogloeaceae bacterium]
FPVTVILNFALYNKMKNDRFLRILTAALLAVLVVVFYPLAILGGLIYIIYRIDKRCNPQPQPPEKIPEPPTTPPPEQETSIPHANQK